MAIHTRIVYDLESSDSENEAEESVFVYECEGIEEDNVESSEEEHLDEIQPYMYEPECSDSEDVGQAQEEAEINGVGDEDRMGMFRPRTQFLDWCECEQCQLLPTNRECVCCQELAALRRRLEEGETMYNRGNYSCITVHPGFQAACLNVHVLEIAWLQYKQQCDVPHEGPDHKRWRHVAYRQLARWCWGYLGKNVRVALPSCAVSCIRAHFPPPQLNEENFVFTGFLH